MLPRSAVEGRKQSGSPFAVSGAASACAGESHPSHSQKIRLDLAELTFQSAGNSACKSEESGPLSPTPKELRDSKRVCLEAAAAQTTAAIVACEGQGAPGPAVLAVPAGRNALVGLGMCEV